MGWNPPSGPPPQTNPPPSPSDAAASVVDAATQVAGAIADAAGNAGDSAAAAGETAAGTATEVIVEVVDAIGVVLDHVAEEGRAAHREGVRARSAAEATWQAMVTDASNSAFEWRFVILVGILVVVIVVLIVVTIFTGGTAVLSPFLALISPLLRDALRDAVDRSGSPEPDSSGSVDRLRRVEQLVIEEIRRGRHPDAPPTGPPANLDPLRVLVRGLPAQLSRSKRPGSPSPATLAAVGERLDRLGRVVAVVAGTAQRRGVDPRIAGALWKLRGKLSTTVAALAQAREAAPRVNPWAPNLGKV